MRKTHVVGISLPHTHLEGLAAGLKDLKESLDLNGSPFQLGFALVSVGAVCLGRSPH